MISSPSPQRSGSLAWPLPVSVLPEQNLLHLVYLRRVPFLGEHFRLLRIKTRSQAKSPPSVRAASTAGYAP
jgi:hypothetical protein